MTLEADTGVLRKMSGQERIDLESKIIIAYTEELVPIIKIASQLHVCRQSIWKILKKLGVDTSKSRRIQVKCNWCEKTFYKKVSQVRRRRYHYCNEYCHISYIKEIGQPYIQNRGGQRRARSAVNIHFKLDDIMIVHHENKDTLDNRLTNLRVFKNHSEHMSYHRGGKAIPIWDGRDILETNL